VDDCRFTTIVSYYYYLSHRRTGEVYVKFTGRDKRKKGNQSPQTMITFILYYIECIGIIIGVVSRTLPSYVSSPSVYYHARRPSVHVKPPPTPPYPRPACHIKLMRNIRYNVCIDHNMIDIPAYKEMQTFVKSISNFIRSGRFLFTFYRNYSYMFQVGTSNNKLNHNITNLQLDIYIYVTKTISNNRIDVSISLCIEFCIHFSELILNLF